MADRTDTPGPSPVDDYDRMALLGWADGTDDREAAAPPFLADLPTLVIRADRV